MSADRNMLEDLHSKLAKKFAEALEAGTCTAAELNVIRQFLKDNNISGIPAAGTPLKAITDSMDLTPEEEEFLRSAQSK